MLTGGTGCDNQTDRILRATSVGLNPDLTKTASIKLLANNPVEYQYFSITNLLKTVLMPDTDLEYCLAETVESA